MKACDLGENGGIKSRLNEIQKIVNDFDLENMSNLPQWVSDLNVKIENVLAKRLEGLMDQWVQEFRELGEKGGGTLIEKKLVCLVKLQNRTIILDPPLAEVKAFWYKELHTQVEKVCGLERPDLTR